MANPTNKVSGFSFEQIVREAKVGQFYPVYILMGEETFFIDYLTELLVDTLIPKEQRDFDLETFFGADTHIDQVILAARSYPMMATRKVVVLREAQALSTERGQSNAKTQLNRLELYLRQPQPNTVLIVCYKGDTLDARSKTIALASKIGVVFDAKPLNERSISPFIQTYIGEKGVKIDPNAITVLTELIGNNLSRLTHELDKLFLVKPKDSDTISHELVVNYIGMSKEFTIFDLQNALISKDVLKANRIIYFFASNKKEYPPIRDLAFLFRFFSNILVAHYSPDKTPEALASWLGLSPFQVKKSISPALQVFTPMKTLQIISMIRRTDARLKGVGNPSISDADLMRELIYFILH